MTTASNSYAEKVYAEHPIALWTLDEPVDYISLISEANRNMSDWSFYDKDNQPLTITGIPYYTSQQWKDQSFPIQVFPSVGNKITVPDAVIGTTGNMVKSISGVIANQSDFDTTLDTFAIGVYLHTFNKQLSISYGIEYTDSNSNPKRLTRTGTLFASEEWQFLSTTFDLPSDFQDIKVFIDIEYAGQTTDYFFLVHGLSVGQWAEQYHSQSLGVEIDDINYREVGDETPGLVIDGYGISANAYGLRSNNGYYLANNNRLRATTSGLPIVYGTQNSTVLRPNFVDGVTPEGLPSMVLPGYGFMNQEGQYTDLTLEMWIKIQSSATVPKRIVGPIASEDGLYVNDSFLLLKVGDSMGSYYISEWDRPMLIAIRIGKDAASLVINGEEVISLSLNTDALSFPERLVTIDNIVKSQDWIGFYAYQDVPIIELDCVGIYPYIVPNLVEKRRWVYGQGVAPSENIKGSDLKSTVVFDYPVANYAKNYSYPDIGRWSQGIVDNLVAENMYLDMPQYTLPEFKFDNRTYDEWFNDVKDDSGLWGTSFSLRPQTDNPENSWENTNGYVLFKSLNLLLQETRAVYGVFEPNENDLSRQTLFFFENAITKENLEIYLEGDTVNYVLKYLGPDGSINEELLDSVSGEYKTGTLLFIGINIRKFADYYGGKTITFFGSPQSISVYVGGSREFQNTYSGKIYRVGFSTARNLAKIAAVFNEKGIAASANNFEEATDLIKDGGTVFRTQNNAGEFISGYETVITSNPLNDPPTAYWEEVLDGGDSYFGNLNSEFDEVIDGGGVQSLLIETVLGHIASYTLIPKIFLNSYILDIGINGYWQDYLPLSYFAKYVTGEDNNQYYGLDFIQLNVGYPAIFKFLKGRYDTSNSIVKTYISFQPLEQPANAQPNAFLETARAPSTGVVEPGENWLTVRYEVVDDTVIYPPPNIDFQNVAIVFHIEVISSGIIENPIKIQTLQLASQVFNPFMANAIGTKFGAEVYPYVRSGAYYDYKRRNPFSIYKGSTPYLYLTGKSGLQLRQLDSVTLERGISIPINKSASSFYRVSAFQAAIRYDAELFPENVTEIMEIYSKSRSSGETKTIKIYMVPDSNQRLRGKLYAVDGETGLAQDGVTFYLNGVPTINPVINLRSWSLVSILFNTPLQFDGEVGALRITGPIMFNNVSQYQNTQLDESSRTVYRRWAALFDEGEKWFNWYDSGANPEIPRTGDPGVYTWREVLFISTDSTTTTDGNLIYKKYTGTDRIVVDSDAIFRLGKYRYAIYSDIIWRTNTVTPA